MILRIFTAIFTIIFFLGSAQAANNNFIKLIPYYNCTGCYTVEVTNPWGTGSYIFDDGWGFTPALDSPDSLNAYVFSRTVTVVGDAHRWGRIDVVSFGGKPTLLADEQFIFQEIASNQDHSIWAFLIEPLSRYANIQDIDVIDLRQAKEQMVEKVFDCVEFGEPLSTDPGMLAITWIPQKNGFIFLNCNTTDDHQNDYLFVFLQKNKKWISKKLTLNFDVGGEPTVVGWENNNDTVEIRASGGIMHTVELTTGVCHAQPRPAKMKYRMKKDRGPEI